MWPVSSRRRPAMAGSGASRRILNDGTALAPRFLEGTESDFRGLPEPGARSLNDMTKAWVVSSGEAQGRVIERLRTAAEDRAESLVRSVDSGAAGEGQTW